MTVKKLSHSQTILLDNLRNSRNKRILFVCLGNICRSPAAQGIFQSIVDADSQSGKWTVDSAGIGSWHVGQLPDKRMRIHATRRGIDLIHVCRQIRESDFDDFDIIIGMDSMNLEDLKRLSPSLESSHKIFPMAFFVDQSMACDHIPDPYYSGSEGFEMVLDLLVNGCMNLYERIK